MTLNGDRDGGTYNHSLDYERLNTQAAAVWGVMSDGEWHTLEQIAKRTGYPEASISARIRDFRKPRFGSQIIERRRHHWGGGLFLYRVVPKEIS